MENQNENTILSSIGEIYETRNKSLFSASTLDPIMEEHLKIVSDFFEVDYKTAAVFSLVICDQLSGDSESITSIMKSLGFKPLDFITTNDTLKKWKLNGLLRLRVVRGNKPTNDYQFINEVLDGVIYNDKSKLKHRVPKNQNEAFLVIKQFISKTLYSVEKEILAETILNYVYHFNEFELISEILVDTDLSDDEKAILFYIISHHQYGIQEFDLDIILDYFDEDSSFSFRFKQQVIAEKCGLFSKEYLAFDVPDFLDFSVIVPGERIKKHIVVLENGYEKKTFTTKYSIQIKPEEIEEIELHFNSETESATEKVVDITSSKFKSVSEKFAANGMKAGLTMLFYGLPGTGKTELVKQIAKKNNRVLLLVDIASIKSKWVGESERNIKRVFYEYKMALKFYENEPILFFNECDALIGKRNHVANAVDQMNNSMQNIVLQELEDFQGIFVATSNLIENIDKAFDRRILYKLLFDQPEETTRLAILKSQFPDVESDILEEISERYNLSGGQIQNIKKKYLVDEILFESVYRDDYKLKKYIESEVNFRKSTTKTIGF
jgi:AAA+ superfamily predicted ATPase